MGNKLVRGERVRNKKVLIVKDIIKKVEATNAADSDIIINELEKLKGQFCEVDFSGVELVNSVFLKPIARYIVNGHNNRKITLVGFKENQRALVREVLMSARRLHR